MISAFLRTFLLKVSVDFKQVQTAIFFIFISSFMGCDSGLKVACDEIPVLIREIHEQKNTWVAYVPSHLKSGRQPASAIPQSLALEFPAEKSKKWVEKLIKKSHSAKDAFEDDQKATSEVLKEFDEATMTLVHLHGYLSKNDVQGSLQYLNHFEEKLVQLESKICD